MTDSELEGLRVNEYTQRRAFMRRAVELGKKSEHEAVGKPAVGVVIVRGSEILGESYRGATGEGDHAEYGLIKSLKADGVDLRGATVFTTLEPCSRRNHPKVPCAQHIIEAGIGEVVVGIYDPNPSIFREGWGKLREAGIKLTDFDEDFREDIRADNSEFIGQYLVAVGDRGSARFDFSMGDGKFKVQADGDLEFTVQFAARSADGVYIQDYGSNVAEMRFATAFDEIDDPGAMDWSHYSRPLDVGEIGALRQGDAYLLVKIREVHWRQRGADRTEVAFDFEVRRKREIPPRDA